MEACDQTQMNGEIPWINTLRALCMICVYLAHCCAYSGIPLICGTRFFQPFYVNAFFVISGYLLFRKFFLISAGEREFIRKKAWNVFYKIMVPSLFLSFVLFIPKSLFNGRNFSFCDFFLQVPGGISYWFTSTLAISQLILLFLFMILPKKMIYFCFVSVFLYFLAIFLKQIDPTPFPWYYKSGLGAIPFLVVGGIYSEYEDVFCKYKKVICPLLVFGYLFFVLTDFDAPSAMLSVRMNLYGFYIAVSSILMMIYLTKMMSPVKILTFIGKNSLSFYLFCGLYPAIFSSIARKISMYCTAVVLITFFSLGAAYGSTLLLNRFVPFIYDVRNLHFKK